MIKTNKITFKLINNIINNILHNIIIYSFRILTLAYFNLHLVFGIIYKIIRDMSYEFIQKKQQKDPTFPTKYLIFIVLSYYICKFLYNHYEFI